MCVGSCGSQKKASDSSETVMDSCYGYRKLNSGRAVLLTPRPISSFFNVSHTYHFFVSRILSKISLF